MFQADPSLLFIDLSEEYGEDEQLALEDVYELHGQSLNWKMICLKGSPIHQNLIQYGESHMITLDQKPREYFDRDLKSILTREIISGVNVVHAFSSNYLGSILPWLISYPTTSVIVTEGPRVKKTIWHYLQSFFYPRVDAVLVPSVALKRRIQVMRPSLAPKIRVIHDGLDFHMFNPDSFDFTVLRKKWGIDSTTFLVGMIASPEYVKAQSAFIKAAASFLRNEELAKRTKFVIVGFEQDGNEDLIDLIRLFHLQDQILLVPFEESIPKVLGTLDVYVMPSSKAMFGLQAIEALAMGTPIICAQSPDASEWIGNSQGGLLMRSGDSFDLQRRLRAILEDPEELKQMGKRASQFARENYDRKTRTLKLVQLYEKLIKRRKDA